MSKLLSVLRFKLLLVKVLFRSMCARDGRRSLTEHGFVSIGATKAKIEAPKSRFLGRCQPKGLLVGRGSSCALCCDTVEHHENEAFPSLVGPRHGNNNVLPEMAARESEGKGDNGAVWTEATLREM